GMGGHKEAARPASVKSASRTGPQVSGNRLVRGAGRIELLVEVFGQAGGELGVFRDDEGGSFDLFERGKPEGGELGIATHAEAAADRCERRQLQRREPRGFVTRRAAA